MGKSVQGDTLADELPSITISALENIGIDQLEAVVKKKLESLCDTAKAPFILNARQRPLVRYALEIFQDIRTKIVDGVDYEIVAPMVRSVVAHLSGLTGKDIDRRVINEIFKSFCIGK